MLRRCPQVGYLITLLILPYLNVAATSYKWSDSQGRVHYGDRPPPDQTVESVKVPPSPGRKPAPQMQEKVAEPATDGTPQENPSSPETKASSKQVMEENCQIAQRNLKILTSSGRRVHAMGADGKTYVLDDNQRELKLSETRKEIAKFCQ